MTVYSLARSLLDHLSWGKQSNEVILRIYFRDENHCVTHVKNIPIDRASIGGKHYVSLSVENSAIEQAPILPLT